MSASATAKASSPPSAHVAAFERWAADRTLLDDEWQPKKASCLRDEHNEELAKHVPVEEVLRAGRSLLCFAWRLHGCTELVDALVFPG